MAKNIATNPCNTDLSKTKTVQNLQLRRGKLLNLPQPLKTGELGWAMDVKKLYIGTSCDYSPSGVQVKNGEFSYAQSVIDNSFIVVTLSQSYTKNEWESFKKNVTDNFSDITENFQTYDGDTTALVGVPDGFTDTSSLTSYIFNNRDYVTNVTLGASYTVDMTEGTITSITYEISGMIAHLLNNIADRKIATNLLNVKIYTSSDGVELVENKGEPNGYAPLDSNGQVPASFLPSSSIGGGLDYWEEVLFSASPNDTRNTLQWTTTEGTTNVNVALTPKGNGSIQGQVADNEITGGAPRGNHSVDLQMVRTAASQVVWGDNSVIIGGSSNTVPGNNSSIVGGLSNLIPSDYSFIGGGQDHSINSHSGAIGGGQNNAIKNLYGIIGGGLNNNINGSYEAITGGQSNNTSNGHTFVGGGQNNNSHASHSSVVGGFGNQCVNGSWQFLGGGSENTVSASLSAIVGGDQQDLAGSNSFIGGGRQHLLTGDFSSVVSGLGIENHSDYSFVGGGQNNTLAASNHSSIVGGSGNSLTSTSTYSSINGGQNNTISSSTHSVVLGGHLNNVNQSNYSLAAGRRSKVLSNHNGSFILSDSQNLDHESTQDNEMRLRFQNGVYINGNEVFHQGNLTVSNRPAQLAIQLDSDIELVYDGAFAYRLFAVSPTDRTAFERNAFTTPSDGIHVYGDAIESFAEQKFHITLEVYEKTGNACYLAIMKNGDTSSDVVGGRSRTFSGHSEVQVLSFSTIVSLSNLDDIRPALIPATMANNELAAYTRMTITPVTGTREYTTGGAMIGS